MVLASNSRAQHGDMPRPKLPLKAATYTPASPLESPSQIPTTASGHLSGGAGRPAKFNHWAWLTHRRFLQLISANQLWAEYLG